MQGGVNREELQAWMEAHADELARDVGELVAIRSVSVPGSETSPAGASPFGEGCAKVLDKGLEIMARHGFETRNHEGHCGSAVWKGESPSEIGVFGHLDVVPEGTDWTGDPFVMREEAGHDGETLLIGRGVSDNKGPAMAGVYGVRYLMAAGYRPRHTIRVYLGLAEEVGMSDLTYYLERNPMPRFALVPDGSFPVCNGEKGILILEISHPVSGRIVEFRSGEASNAVPATASAILALPFDDVERALGGKDVTVERVERRADHPAGARVTARGVAAHAAFPENSVNAMARLAGILADSYLLDGNDQQTAAFLAESFATYYGEGLGVPFRDKTGYVTHIGGMTEVRGGRLTQNINIRYPMGVTAEELIEAVTARAEAHGFTTAVLKIDPPTFIPAENPIVAALNNIANSVLGRSDPPYAMGFTYARKLKDAVSYGVLDDHEANPMPPGHGKFHQPDECIRKSSLVRAAMIYALAIREVDERC